MHDSAHLTPLFTTGETTLFAQAQSCLFMPYSFYRLEEIKNKMIAGDRKSPLILKIDPLITFFFLLSLWHRAQSERSRDHIKRTAALRLRIINPARLPLIRAKYRFEIYLAK
jgi:hypothetical protein